MLIERGLPYSISARTTFELTDDGLRCSILLPLEEVAGGDRLATHPSAIPRVETQTDLAGRRILVVEDDFNIADYLATALEMRGAKIIGPIATLKTALALVGVDGQIDGAVLDVDLRGERSYPVAEILRGRGIPVVFTTGYDKSFIEPRYADVPCLQKPAKIERVIEALLG